MLDRMSESFPMLLYRRFSEGESVEQLAARFGIPEERVAVRLRVAEQYAERRRTGENLLVLRDRLLDN
jgi:DNA-directed RNA polymerase specialized sigma24 family protein